MTTWVELTANELGVDKFAKSTTVTALFNNVKAFAEKASGAPQLANDYITAVMIAAGQVTTPKIASGNITQGLLANSAVAQAKLKGASGEISTTGTLHGILPGGNYGFYPTLRTDVLSGTQEAHIRNPAQISTTFTPYITIITDSSTMRAQQLYIQASPPYDLGDGEVPLFVYAAIDAAGNVVATWIAPDPPWANNGPTDIRPAGEDVAGRPFRWVRQITPLIQAKLDSADPNVRAEGYAERDTMPRVPVLITYEFKNTDMALVPQPFNRISSDREGLIELPTTKILIDPVSELCEKLRILHANGESVGEIVQNYLNIDNVPLARQIPPGVQAFGATWKQT
jgi:hypothetical protein